MGRISIDDGHRFGVETFFYGLFLRETCLSDSILESLHDGRSGNSTEGRGNACYVIGNHTSLPVRHRPHGLPRPFAGDEMFCLDAVASRIYIRIACPHVCIDDYAALFADLESGVFRNCRVWTNSHCHENHVRGNFPFVRPYGGKLPIATDNFLHFLSSVKIYTPGFERLYKVQTKFLFHHGRKRCFQNVHY
ncbi:MAG: hypothetical protein XE12_1586 [Synergistales bacterium 54_9]|nr:MAG: hypothetical protein XE12_1586 [Synergistales bacterium 54_9]